jgi:hypothetical protein
MATDFSLDADRRRVGWWLVVVFSSRPSVCSSIRSSVPSSSDCSSTTARGRSTGGYGRPSTRRASQRRSRYFLIVVPTLALLGYTGVVAFGQFTSAASSDAVGSLLGQLPGNQQSIAGVLDSLPQSVSGFGQFGQLS